MAKKIKTVLDLTAEEVVRAYSGKAERCMCGCSGTYYQGGNPAHRANCTRVLHVIQASENAYRHDDDKGNHWVSARVGRRIYVAYLKGE